MTCVLVVGVPNSGKSARAEEIARALAENGAKLYIATMVPYGDEGAKRVKRHRKLREGKGFETIEKPTALQELVPTLVARPNASCLLECVANLVANEMYDTKNAGLTHDELVARVVEQVDAVRGSCAALTIVTNEFELDAPGYDDSTREYAKLMRDVNAELAKLADRVERVVNGEWITQYETR